MARDPVAEALRAHRSRKRLARKGIRVKRSTGNPGHNPGRGESAFKAQAAAELNREQLRKAIAGGNLAMSAARAEREAELGIIRERCGLARQKLKEQCAAKRTRTRTTAKARIEAAKRDKREAHAFARAYRGAKPKTRRRAIEAIQESDSAVETEILAMTPELLPVWQQVKRGIKGGPRKSRAEAFFQYAEENAGEVQAILAELPEDEDYSAEYAAWAANQ